MSSINQKTVGIIGGGQLGKMMILEGKKLGIKFNILDPFLDCPSRSISDKHIIGNYNEHTKIRELAESVDVLTYEFEHIDSDFLIDLENEGYNIYPSPKTLNMIQDKLRQKTFLKLKNLNVPKFIKVDKEEDILKAIDLYGLPLVIKNTTGGYDGKGNYILKDKKNIKVAIESLKDANHGIISLMAEEFIDYEKEISVIASRGVGGIIDIYPIAENIHEDSILKKTIVPARINSDIEKKAKELAFNTLKELEGCGVFTIEMFVSKDSKVYLNEIAPRVHNSGHYTIEACYTSQFMQHIRAILSLPLGSSKMKVDYAFMINLLGEKDYIGKSHIDGFSRIFELENVYLHFYGKNETMPFRKMGHITILDSDLKRGLDKCKFLQSNVKVISK